MTQPMDRRHFLAAMAGTALLGAGTRTIADSAQAGAAGRVGGGPSTGELSGGGPGTGELSAGQLGATQSSGPPPITVTVPPEGTAPGYILLTPFSLAYQSGPTIIDSAGKVIWFQQVQGFTTNLEVQRYRGQRVLTWWEGSLILPEGYGEGQCRILDTSYRQIGTVAAGNGLQADLHDFTITPEGTALITVYQQRRHDLSALGGPRHGILLDSLFQEVDIVTGRVLHQWRASRHVPLEESYMSPPSSPTKPYDFFHINSIDVEPDGNLLVSARNTCCVYKIERTTGRIIWRLHGKKSDFRMGPGTRFQLQHDARHHPGNVLTIFDDGEAPEARESRGIKLHVDFRTRQVELLDAYVTHHPPTRANNQGSVQLLPNGNAFVGWGSAPLFTEFSPDGKILYEARLPVGVSSYRAFRFRWPAPPSAAPAPPGAAAP